MKAPCYGCPNAGCGAYHDICKKYQEFRAYKDGEIAKNRKKGEADYDIKRVSMTRFDRLRKYSPRS